MADIQGHYYPNDQIAATSPDPFTTSTNPQEIAMKNTLPPLPPTPIVLTGWLPIVNKPVRSGYYDLLTVDMQIEHRYFNADTGHWMCVSGSEPATVYTFWRGLTHPIGYKHA